MQNVTGIVQKVFVKELEAPKTFVHQGKRITVTHRHALQLDDGNWYGFGESDKDVFLGKDPSDGKNKILGEGSKVLILYTLSPCGKYRNAKKSNMTVLDFVQGQKWEPQGQQQAQQDNVAPETNRGGKDFSGVKVGHAINAAMLLLNNNAGTPQNLIAVAQQLHDVSLRVEEVYKKLNPGANPYDIGAAAGNAVLNACKMTDNVEEVEKKAINILRFVVPAVTAYVKGEVAQQQQTQSAAPAEQVQQQQAPVQQAPVEQPPVQEATQKTEENSGFDGFGDMDDFDMEDVSF